MSDVNDFIEHYGKKGMKWGVRKAKTPKKTSVDYKRSRELGKKGAPALSNKQLEEFNKRLNLETSYNRLNPSKVEKGHKQVQAILAIAGTGAAVYNMANSPAGKAAVSKLLKK